MGYTLNDVRDAGLAIKRKYGISGKALMGILTPALGYSVPALTEVKPRDYGKAVRAFQAAAAANPNQWGFTKGSDAGAEAVEAMQALNDAVDKAYDIAGARYVGMAPELGMPYGEDPYSPLAREAYTPKTAPDILQRAAKHMQDRAAARDQAGGERSMRRTVDAFNALTGHAVSERDGWLFMAVLKMARATTTPTGTPDDYEDLAAYAALAGESAQEVQA